MEVHTPSYFTQFHCLAGACPHTCCAWWEVPVDEPTLHRLKDLSGPLGERARAALTTDEEGDPCLALTGGYCPLLEENGLCALQLQEGEGALPAVCRQHPRFSYDYGSIREEGLCASCPEAARLILEGDFTLAVTHAPRAGEGEEDPLLAPMLKARQTALGLLREEAPLGQRLCALLAFGNHLQNALDEGEEGAIGDICALYDGALPLLEGVELPSRREGLGSALETLAGLEQLQPEWGALLSAGRARRRPPRPGRGGDAPGGGVFPLPPLAALPQRRRCAHLVRAGSAGHGGVRRAKRAGEAGLWGGFPPVLPGGGTLPAQFGPAAGRSVAPLYPARAAGPGGGVGGGSFAAGWRARGWDVIPRSIKTERVF